ncbi:MAG: rod shape-determining protein MreC [Rhodoferax sp.]|nr:rod shape-determining protein MreC [Rhodoferax sp.]
MPLGTLERSPPPFFRQGPSALSKLFFFGLLALLLMVADRRFHVAQPVRVTLASALYPLQWVVLRPFVWLDGGARYFQSLQASQADAATAQYQLGLQSQRAQQVEQLTLENARLRQLLELRARINAPALAAQVLYDMADPFSQKIVIDKGALSAVQAGSPVLDEWGVLGQVTQVYPLVSEVTLLTDRQQAIPVLNARSGVRALAFGSDSALVLRFLGAQVDMQAGDLLTTSGIDGVYPPGLQVARVSQVERQADASFARISATPVAQLRGSLHVLVLKTLAGQIPDNVASPPASLPPRQGGRK